jgi:hypothetical protein
MINESKPVKLVDYGTCQFTRVIGGIFFNKTIKRLNIWVLVPDPFFNDPSLVRSDFHFQKAEFRFDIFPLPYFKTVEFSVVMVIEHVQVRGIVIIGLITENLILAYRKYVVI